MENNPKITKDKVTVSLGWKLFERFSCQGINLVVQIVIARILLPSDFGSLAIIAAITNYASIFVNTGLGTAIIQKKDLHPKDVSTLLTASLTVAAFLYILLYIFSPQIVGFYNQPGLLWPMRVLTIVLFLNALSAILNGLLARSMNFKALFTRSILSVPISGAVGIIMAYMGYGVWALIAHILVQALVTVVVMYLGSDYKITLGFSLERAKTLYSFSWKIMFASLLSGFSDTLRAMVIGKKYTTSQLAYYSKAYTYTGYINTTILGSIQSVMLPVFSRQQDSIDVIKRTMRKAVKLSTFVLFPVLLGMCVMAKPLVLILLTEKWAPSIPFIVMFCVLRLFSSVTSMDKQVYLGLGKSHIGMFYEIGLLCVNLILLFITVPISVSAIAIGVVVVEFFGSLTLMIISRRVYSYHLRERFLDFLKPLLNSLVMMVVMWLSTMFVSNNLLLLLVQIIFGVAVYIVLAKITKDDSLQEIKELLLNLIAKKRKS